MGVRRRGPARGAPIPLPSPFAIPGLVGWCTCAGVRGCGSTGVWVCGLLVCGVAGVRAVGVRRCGPAGLRHRRHDRARVWVGVGTAGVRLARGGAVRWLRPGLLARLLVCCRRGFRRNPGAAAGQGCWGAACHGRPLTWPPAPRQPSLLTWRTSWPLARWCGWSRRRAGGGLASCLGCLGCWASAGVGGGSAEPSCGTVGADTRVNPRIRARHPLFRIPPVPSRQDGRHRQPRPPRWLSATSVMSVICALSVTSAVPALPAPPASPVLVALPIRLASLVLTRPRGPAGPAGPAGPGPIDPDNPTGTNGPAGATGSPCPARPAGHPDGAPSHRFRPRGRKRSCGLPQVAGCGKRQWAGRQPAYRGRAAVSTLEGSRPEGAGDRSADSEAMHASDEPRPA